MLGVLVLHSRVRAGTLQSGGHIGPNVSVGAWTAGSGSCGDESVVPAAWPAQIAAALRGRRGPGVLGNDPQAGLPVTFAHTHFLRYNLPRNSPLKHVPAMVLCV